MYSVFIALAVGAAAGTASRFLPWMSWWLAPIPGITAALATLILITRYFVKKLEGRLQQAQKLAEKRQFPFALKALEELLPMGRWQLMLEGQIHAQMGVIYFAMRDEEKAIRALSKANPRISDAMLMLASLYFKREDEKKLRATLDLALRLNKKQLIIHNAYAFMLEKLGKGPEAIAILQKALKQEPGNEATKDNLLRLQNGKKPNMKPFGLTWYSLQLEKPPISMLQEQMNGRPGFREKRKVQQ